MKILYCILLSVCITIAHAQSNVDTLFSIANHYYDLQEYDSAIHYFNEMLRKASTKDSRASALNGIGVVYSTKGLPDRSIPYYSQAIALYEELHDTTSIMTATNNLAIIYKDKGLYENALNISYNALPTFEHQPPGRPLASIYNTIGTVYGRIQDYTKAYEYYRKSLGVRIAIGYEQGVAQSYNNLGELFNEKKEFDSALANLNKAVEIRRKSGDDRGLGRTLTHIGHSLTYSGKPDAGIIELRKAVDLSRASDDLIAEILALHELGTAYVMTKDFRKAEESLNNASTLIERSENHGYLKRNLELKADLYRKNGDKSRLLNTLERLVVVKDSVLNEEKIESLLALEIQYETEKKAQEIIALQQQSKVDQAELKTRRSQTIALLAVSVLIGIITILAYRLYKQTKKEKLRAELHTKEVQHRMKNHLQILSSIFTIQAALLEDKQAQELVKSTEGRVTAMALLHKKLYNAGDPTTMSLREYVLDLTKSILFAYGFDENKLTLDLEVVDINMPVDKTIRIGLILNELITNALKYAYSDQVNPSLKVEIKHILNNIQLTVSDNGKNPVSVMPEGKDSFGLRMVRSIIKELKGTIELSNKNGTQYLITIPR